MMKVWFMPVNFDEELTEALEWVDGQRQYIILSQRRDRIDRKVLSIMSLHQSYRIHPTLKQCLSHVLYDDELATTLAPEHCALRTSFTFRCRFESFQFSIPCPGNRLRSVPLTMQSGARKNRQHSLLRHLCQHVQTASIAILCFYLGIKKMM